MSSPVTLLPRMNGLDVQHVIEVIGAASGPAPGREAVASLPDAVTYAAVGGTPATAQQLADVLKRVEEVARRYGYPDSDSAEQRARFDAACTELLATMPLFQSGEALRDDVWAFMATCLLTRVTFWRYGTSPDRWHGGIRNTFQRLWVRGRALDRGPYHEDRWGLLQALSEDALVAITERTAIAAQRPLALAIGEGWLRAAARYGRSRMESVMRRAVIHLRLKNEVTALAMLPAPALTALVDQAFTRAAESLGLEPIEHGTASARRSQLGSPRVAEEMSVAASDCDASDTTTIEPAPSGHDIRGRLGRWFSRRASKTH